MIARLSEASPFQRHVVEEDAGEVYGAGGEGDQDQGEGRRAIAEGDEQDAEHAHRPQPEDVAEDVLGALPLQQHLVPDQRDPDQPLRDDRHEGAVGDDAAHRVPGRDG